MQRVGARIIPPVPRSEEEEAEPGGGRSYTLKPSLNAPRIENFDHAVIVNTSGPPTSTPASSASRSAAGSSWAQRAQVGGPLQWLRLTDVGRSGAPGGFPHEPQAAEGGGVVVYSGNSGGFFSVDGGVTFSALSQPTIFGPGGGGYCCDTLVRYAPNIDRFLWLLQGNCTAGCGLAGRANNSKYVLAIASPEQIRSAARARTPVEAAWETVNLDHALFPGVVGWFDYPDMAVGRSNLYLTWNRLSAAGNNLGTLNVRLSLSALRRGTPVAFSFRELEHGDRAFWRTAQLPGPRGIWLSNYDSRDDMSVAYILEDGSQTVLSTRLPHLRLPLRDYVSRNPFGQDWATRTNISSGSVRAGTVRGDELWVGWAIGRGYNGQTANVFPQPGVQYAAFRLPPPGAPLPDQLSVRAQDYVVNRSMGMTYPYFTTTGDGEVAMAASMGGPLNPPGPVVGFLTGRDRTLNSYAGGTFVNSPGDRQQGDYSSVQPSYPSRGDAVAAGYNLMPDGNHYWFFRFRRGLGTVRQSTALRLACPAKVTAGVDTSVLGQLTPALAGAQITIEYGLPGEVDRFVRQVTTDGRGRFADTFAFGSQGAWTVRVTYAGDATYNSASAACTVNATAQAPSSLTLACPANAGYIGGTVAVSGALSPAIAGASISVGYQPVTGPEIVNNVLTDAQGRYSDTYTTSQSGNLTIRASYAGTAQTAGATASPCTLFVQPIPS